MKLNILERISLLNVIPREGNALTLRIIRDLQSKLSFSEEELKEFGIKNSKTPDGRISIDWDEDIIGEVDIEIGEMATTVIKKELTKLDKQNLLKMEALTLYEKFVEGKIEEKA